MQAPQNNPTGLQNTYYLSVSFIALCALFWVGINVGHYFSNIVLMLGLVILFTYLLLSPVNVIHRLIESIFAKIRHLTHMHWVSNTTVSHLSRALAILAVYVGFIVTVVILSVAFVPSVVNELSSFLGAIPSYTEQAEDWLSQQPVVQQYLNQAEQEATLKQTKQHLPQLPKNNHESQVNTLTKPSPIAKDKNLNHKEALKNRITESVKTLQTFLIANVNQSIGNLIGLLGSTLSSLVYTLTGLVLLFYLLLDGKTLKQNFVLALPKEYQNQAEYFVSEFHKVMLGFIKGQLVLGIFTGSFMFLLYTLFGIPYALVLGAVFAIAEVIPVVGTWIGFTPGIIVMLFMHDPVKLVSVMAICYVFQTIKDNILAPKVIGDNIGLHPVVIILSLLVCGQFGGLLGIIYAIPLASMLNVGWRWLVSS